MRAARQRLLDLIPWAACALLLCLLVATWGSRLGYPYDLEWMEGGMLAHAWRLDQGKPLYVPPNLEFIPFVYPPGYAAVVAVLGKVFGLSLPLGRAVSLVGILAAAAALGWLIWRQAGQRSAAAFGAVAFLGAYAGSGAFYDLVRPDSLALAFFGWAVVLAFERHRGAAEAAGLLLCAAFLCKHNLAVLGVPIAVGIFARDGWRRALRFALTAAGPALAIVGLLQVQSGGHFLTYLLDVPTSHPRFWIRVVPGLPRELGQCLPIAAVFPVAWAILRRPVGRWPIGVVISLPIWAGIGVAWYLHTLGPLGRSMHPVPTSFGGWAVGAALGLGAVVLLQLRWQDRVDGSPISWRWITAAAFALTTVAITGAMRAHNGGFLNVYMPLHWVVCLAFGVALARVRVEHGARAVVSLVATAQLLWSAGTIDLGALTPTPEDVETGDAFVSALRDFEGPTLSPFASWMTAQAGGQPSLHQIAVWDLDHRDGPYFEEIKVIDRAMRDQHWSAVVQGTKRFGHGLQKHYRVGRDIAPEGDALQPKTGWDARPTKILVPQTR